jgi:hypothetical protein
VRSSDRKLRRQRFGQATLLGVVFKLAIARRGVSLYSFHIPKHYHDQGMCNSIGGGYYPLHEAVEVALSRLGVLPDGPDESRAPRNGATGRGANRYG